MIKKPVALDPKTHAKLRYTPPKSYGFVSEEIISPVFASELAAVAREYPIVFPEKAELPCAMLGVEEGANAYVGQDGSWQPPDPAA